MSKPYLEVCIGDSLKHQADQVSYQSTLALLQKNATIYGLPDRPEALSDEQRDILQDLSPSPLRFEPPEPLLAGRLTFTLDQALGLAKTRDNFISLCKGDKGMCKNAPNKPLHYKNVPIHRIVKNFIAQGGDITRADGSGGESIFGPKFADAKEGLKNKFQYGSLGMANSGKNSNSSQFFIVLTKDAASLSKLNGKYVCFGKADDVESGGASGALLERLNALAGPGDQPSESVWIGGCGLL